MAVTVRSTYVSRGFSASSSEGSQLQASRKGRHICLVLPISTASVLSPAQPARIQGLSTYRQILQQVPPLSKAGICCLLDCIDLTCSSLHGHLESKICRHCLIEPACGRGHMLMWLMHCRLTSAVAPDEAWALALGASVLPSADERLTSQVDQAPQSPPHPAEPDPSSLWPEAIVPGRADSTTGVV